MNGGRESIDVHPDNAGESGEAHTAPPAVHQPPKHSRPEVPVALPGSGHVADIAQIALLKIYLTTHGATVKPNGLKKPDAEEPGAHLLKKTDAEPQVKHSPVDNPELRLLQPLHLKVKLLFLTVRQLKLINLASVTLPVAGTTANVRAGRNAASATVTASREKAANPIPQQVKPQLQVL